MHIVMLPKTACFAIEATPANIANSAGGLKRDCRPPSGRLGGKTAMKILKFGHFLVVRNCISHIFTSLTNSLAEYLKPAISHPNLVI